MTLLRRRTAFVTVAAVLGVLAAPASAVVLGPQEGLAQVRPATAVAPVPVALAVAE
ncbi:MAG: hypothetical protein JWN08_1332, partial [Frankiales bacterium]|nr:hypothetical protein [Frankiales bacterium]